MLCVAGGASDRGAGAGCADAGTVSHAEAVRLFPCSPSRDDPTMLGCRGRSVVNINIAVDRRHPESAKLDEPGLMPRGTRFASGVDDMKRAAYVLAAGLLLPAAQAATPILTRSYDNGRIGANLTETLLTPQLIASKGLQRVKSLVIDDDPRIE